MSQDANKQAEQKIKLETEMQILENCMEDMKAVYKLNEEKLYFNLIVLRQRSTVLTKTKKHMKKKSQSEASKERNQKREFLNDYLYFQKENQKLTAEYKQFTRWFKDTQQKYENFEKSDEKRIKEIWDMHD